MPRFKDEPDNAAGSRPIRVCWVGLTLTPYHIARLNAAVRCGGLEMHYVSYSNVNDFRALQCDEGVDEAFQRHVLFPGRRIQSLTPRELWARLWAVLEHVRPEAVCVPGWGLKGSAAALAWCVARGAAAVIVSESTREDAERSGWKEWVKARLLGLGGSAFVGGIRHAEYARTLNMAEDRIVTGHNVVDNDHFQVSAVSTPVGGINQRYFLACARFETKKNLPLLIDAYHSYARMTTDPWKLVIAGDGELKPKLMQQIQAYGLSEQVLLPGAVGYSDLPRWYQNAGAFIHASTTEQWGLVVNEAMAAGKPVLVSRQCGCAPDLVREGVNGWTFDATQASELARLMQRITAAGEDLTAMGRASAEIIAAWSPQGFGSALRRAVLVAMGKPRSKARMVDWILLRVLALR
ncbi:glycosyltransferase [Paludibaculum fermentans]|uniref:glycosyltransferase n=1 Tax=Paludibaculum fermentans TaxID=1473598 RepID=UPI003EB88053